jgi:DNA-binding XRE family transcriptional regulator
MSEHLSVENIKWEEVAKRLINYREMTGIDRETFASKVGISINSLTSYEVAKERKSFGLILEICKVIRVSPKWMLTGEGDPFNYQSDEDLLDPLKIDKGAGVRRTSARKDAEEGVMADEMLEFIKSIDQFKRKNKKSFLSWSEVYQIVKYLGYRKVAEKAPHIDMAD